MQKLVNKQNNIYLLAVSVAYTARNFRRRGS